MGDLQLSGPTASFGGQELLCSAGLSSAGKGKRFGGLVQRGEDEKRVLLMLEGSWSAGRGSTCGQIHQATSQRHTNSTPNKACLKKKLIHLLVARLKSLQNTLSWEAELG